MSCYKHTIYARGTQFCRPTTIQWQWICYVEKIRYYIIHTIISNIRNQSTSPLSASAGLILEKSKKREKTAVTDLTVKCDMSRCQLSQFERQQTLPTNWTNGDDSNSWTLPSDDDAALLLPNRIELRSAVATDLNDEWSFNGQLYLRQQLNIRVLYAVGRTWRQWRLVATVIWTTSQTLRPTQFYTITETLPRQNVGVRCVGNFSNPEAQLTESPFRRNGIFFWYRYNRLPLAGDRMWLNLYNVIGPRASGL